MSALLPQLNAPQLDQSSSSAIERYVRAIAGTKMHFVSTRADLADLSDTSVPAYLTEAGCEGEFVWDSSNLSALVTADPRQGIFVASSSDTTGATGAWVRKFSHPYANSQWWGHAPGIGDVSAAKQAAVDTLYAMRGYSGVWSYGSGASIGLYTPASRYGSYNMGSTKIVVSHTMRFLGDSTGQANGGGTVEKWNDLTGGYLFTTTAPGWLLEGFTLVGGFTTTEGEYHAIEFHAAGKVRDVYGLNWSGDFLYENNTSGTNGTSNGFAVDRAYAENCRNGHNAAGSDVNAGEIRGLQTKRCRRAAVLQTGFLGTHYSYCSVTTNALTSLTRARQGIRSVTARRAAFATSSFTVRRRGLRPMRRPERQPATKAGVIGRSAGSGLVFRRGSRGSSAVPAGPISLAG
jgi:hypothetical protein